MMNFPGFIGNLGNQNIPSFLPGRTRYPPRIPNLPIPTIKIPRPSTTTTTTTTVVPSIFPQPVTFQIDYFIPNRPPFLLTPPFVPNRSRIPVTLPPLIPNPSTAAPTTSSLTTTQFVPDVQPFIPNRPPIPPPLSPPSPAIATGTISPTAISIDTSNASTQNMLLTSNNTIDSIFLNNSLSATLGNNFQQEQFSILCGNPGFCTNGVYQECRNQPLSGCERCDLGLAATFLFFVVCLGLGIILGNLLIALVGYRRHKEGKANKMDLCKISLAVADMLTGFHILTVVVYNFSWTINATTAALGQYELESRSLPEAFAGGVLYLFGFTASVYHLCFMGGLRLLAVVFPLKFKFMQNKTTAYLLGLIWILSAIAATSPGWFPEQLTFAYQVSLFLFFPTLSSIFDISSAGISAAFGILSLFYIVPYVLMTTMSFATAITIRYRQHSKRNLFATQASQKTTQFVAKDELAILVTIFIMQAAFTIAIIPTIVVVALFYAGSLECSTVTTPYIVATYFSMSNSLVNIIIYNIREKPFRQMTKKILFGFIPKRFMQDSSTKSSSYPMQATNKALSSTDTGSNSKEAHSKTSNQ